MNSAFGRFVALALLITGALLPVLGQTTHQPFLPDVAASRRGSGRHGCPRGRPG
jgi:hypothetical protein